MKSRLRNKDPFVIPAHINKNGLRLLEYNVPFVFNKIPPEIRNLEHFKDVKFKIKEWLLKSIFELAN